VITDVDGTLVNDERRPTSCAISAVAAFRESGIAFSIISSRLRWGPRPLLGPLGITTPIARFNGGVVAAMCDANPEARRATGSLTGTNREESLANAVKRLLVSGARERAEAMRVGDRTW
jgi:hypothetical protein